LLRRAGGEDSAGAFEHKPQRFSCYKSLAPLDAEIRRSDVPAKPTKPADRGGAPRHPTAFVCARVSLFFMPPPPTILIVDDDEGHSLLIHQNLEESGLTNRIEHYRDGQAFLDFFFDRIGKRVSRSECAYIVLLDIRMPKIDGIEVLRRIKRDPELNKLIVIMLTTADDMRDIEKCYALGCSAYIQKPVDYENFAEAMRRLGQFTDLLMVPTTGGR
jgi:CheY-like chemotaxis protein